MHETAHIWLRLARRLCRKVNFACWLDHAAVPVVVMAGFAAGALLLLRHHAPESGRLWLPVVSALLPLAAMAWAWWRARPHFMGIEDALIRLEVRHRLHAALSTALFGVGAWPAVPAGADDGLHWRWGRAGLPPVLAAGLVAAAWLLPVTARPTPPKISEPAAWTMVESDLQTLVEQRVVDEPSTQETREAIETLRQRPQSEWFDHSSIEAGDRMLLEHERDVAALEGKMRDVARALREAAAPQAGMDPGQAAQQGAEFGKMLEGLRGGGLRPDAELMEKLAEMAGENGAGLNQLNPQQLEEMLKHLEENARLLAEMRDQLQGIPGGMGEGEQGAGDGNGEPGNGEGEPGEGEGDNGRGGPSRGPGKGGPLFGDPKEGVDATLKQPLPTGDMSRAAPGDKLGEGQAEHKIDENDSPGLRSGGAPVQPGDGGGAVGNDTLHPSEQEALRKFFE
jgi:hypothetical protein